MIGRPDFAALGGAGDPRALPAWFQDDVHIVLPDALALATRPDGSPDLRLELARGADAMAGPAAHGTLDLRLRAMTRLEPALARLQAGSARATVRPAAFEAGWLWLLPGEAVIDELSEPVSLAGVGVGARSWTRRLSADTAALLRRVLDEDVLVLGARAHLELTGVAPRLPVKVRFLPRAARDALAGLAPQAGAAVAVDAVERALLDDPASLGLRVLGTVEPGFEPLVARTLTDLVVATLATGAPGTPAGGPALAPLGDDALAAEEVEHDLRRPFLTRRALVLDLSPLTAVRDFVARHGSAPLVVETTMPTLTTGAHDVDVVGNLPAPRTGVLALGASLTAAPRPPERARAVVRAVELTAPEDRARVRLVLGPDEPLAYRVAATAVLSDGTLLEGAPREATGTYVRIDVDDVPVRFVVLEATAGLLALARVHGTVRADAAGGAHAVPFVLDDEQPLVAVALPAAATDAQLDLRARPRFADAPVLALTGLPGNDTRIDLLTFPGYGAQRVALSCTWPAGSSEDCVLELLPEAAAGDAVPERVVLRPQRPAAEYTYFAPSPFAPGYRYRRVRAAGEPAEPWSEPRSPLEPLELSAAAPSDGDWTVLGQLRYAPDGAPRTFRYLPLAPSPQLDPAGRPAVNVLAAGDAAFLQLAAQFDPPADALEGLRATLAAAAGDQAITLVPPPLAVDRCRLLADGEQLGAVATSGFPPWVALFATSLDAAARSAATAALHGERGRLTVAFDARLQGAPLLLEADVATWFAGSPGGPELVATPSISDLGRFDAQRPTTTQPERGQQP